MHEHFVFGYPGWQSDTAVPPYEREATLKRYLDAVKEVKAYGVKTIVDATPNDGGRWFEPGTLGEREEEDSTIILPNCPT